MRKALSALLGACAMLCAGQASAATVTHFGDLDEHGPITPASVYVPLSHFGDDRFWSGSVTFSGIELDSFWVDLSLPEWERNWYGAPGGPYYLDYNYDGVVIKTCGNECFQATGAGSYNFRFDSVQSWTDLECFKSPSLLRRCETRYEPPAINSPYTAFKGEGYLTVYYRKLSEDAWIDVAINDPVASAAPEPATWAMMLMGFFGLGGALRHQKLRRVVGAPLMIDVGRVA